MGLNFQNNSLTVISGFTSNLQTECFGSGSSSDDYTFIGIARGEDTVNWCSRSNLDSCRIPDPSADNVRVTSIKKRSDFCF
jgi:hypothetical protein